jgi:hypothetical protein
MSIKLIWLKDEKVVCALTKAMGAAAWMRLQNLLRRYSEYVTSP